MHILCISGSQACLCITITWEAFLADPDPPPTDLISLAWGKALAIYFFFLKSPRMVVCVARDVSCPPSGECLETKCVTDMVSKL